MHVGGPFYRCFLARIGNVSQQCIASQHYVLQLLTESNRKNKRLRTYLWILLIIETGAQGEKAPLISLPRSTAPAVATIKSNNTVTMQTQMPSAAQIVSLVTFFEIRQRK